MAKGILFVIVAPSGAGKSTLINKIRERFPDLTYSISCATRAPRRGEVDGKHYYFVSRETFENMIARDEFLEWKEVHGNLYGTPAGPVLKALARGERMILDIDVEGAREVLQKIPEAVGIFIRPPNMATLEKRLRGRGTDSEEVIRVRLHNAVGEMAAEEDFEHRLVNDELDRAVEELASIISDASADTNSHGGERHNET
jgi:guanylate kinase